MAKALDDVARELVNFHAAPDLDSAHKRIRDVAKQHKVELKGTEMSDEDYQALIPHLRNP